MDTVKFQCHNCGAVTEQEKANADYTCPCCGSGDVAV